MGRGRGIWKTIGFSLLIVIIVLFVLFLLAKWNQENQNAQDRSSVCVNGYCWFIEVRDTPDERALGLMFKENLPQNEAMLFIFEKEAIYSFWMKNTLIPLDMVWLDSSGKIVYVQENALPCKQDPCMSYTPDSLAKYVLEFNSGTAKKYGFKNGDKVDILNVDLNK